MSTPVVGLANVYIAGCHNGAHKIGYSSRVRERIAQIDVQGLVAWSAWSGPMPARVARGVEQALHQRCAPDRLRGEWYRLTAANVAFVRAVLAGEVAIEPCASVMRHRWSEAARTRVSKLRASRRAKRCAPVAVNP